MGAKEIIGHIDCPVCKFEMPVKADKNGHAYAHCAHGCQAQVFTRNAHRDGLLRAKMRPVTGSGTDTVTEPAVPTVTVPKAPEPAVTVPAPSAPPAPRANWFQPIMGAKHGRA